MGGGELCPKACRRPLVLEFAALPIALQLPLPPACGDGSREETPLSTCPATAGRAPLAMCLVPAEPAVSYFAAAIASNYAAAPPVTTTLVPVSPYTKS